MGVERQARAGCRAGGRDVPIIRAECLTYQVAESGEP